MGLTHNSTKMSSLKDMFDIDNKENQFVIALAGNPNTGKSTVFNHLTGLRQHTGNWPGKTVATARGNFKYKNTEYALIDLPGTYSLFALSQEEIVARDFICFGNPDAVIVVCDATCLERNLNLVFQVMELTDKVILCINLIDEARKKGITIDKKLLEDSLGIPVILTAARNGSGMDELLDTLNDVSFDKYKLNNKPVRYNENIENVVKSIQPELDNIIPGINSRWLGLRLIDGDESIFESMSNYIDKDSIDAINEVKKKIPDNINKQKIRDEFTKINYDYAKKLSDECCSNVAKKSTDREEKVDKILTSKIFGLPIMLLLLGTILWITIEGANYPSTLLSNLLLGFEPSISGILNSINCPSWLNDMLVLGLYRTLAWVISVMLPPMAIFFPLFTLLEDFGYLPRVAFNLDHLFKKACAHGKQCLTMCMGFGCNAAGVIGCRIIDSPRERLIAILTNNFVPCNGRFPTLIAISTIFFSSVITNSFVSSVATALCITLLIILGVIITLLVSYTLSKTLLKGVPSTFTLELPPYRVPQIGRTLYTSIIDRTIFVLGRAVMVAIPAGVITWIFANIYIGDLSILSHVANFLDPLAKLIGLDGFILLAFILGFPANEIVVPILLMAYLATGSMIELDSFSALGQVLREHGWTYLTALNVMLFSLLHWPCATTLLTIKKETGSLKWTALGFLMPTILAFVVCFLTTTVYNLFI
ncbi:ferrous iron transporter B [Clostridium sp. HMSC19D02]|uniref:ferrous iron transport protein B n=1 Tax=Clostridioides difficile TaxID=1496 RepID=UPI00038DA9E6|nr:ferrous iron transport protein B [Clostridioides difficile]OFU05654.1 ferrous iron transporter B [Clostridium sp. HMSC19D02]AXU82674.1 ferrous ion transport protein [Clostridioides difficile]EGT3639888.1 ferrous iron transport protein B [Clostridioides difficile]EGT3680349.1 ferrous iron transport protein B [Clostridioides difficile]EGT3809619.1 ferrous iron transport protein B [Clostridioides difficile]